MNKGTHFIGQPMYGQLLNLLDKAKILRFSREMGGERYVKHFDAWQHLVIMRRIGQFAGFECFESLITANFAGNSNAKKQSLYEQEKMRCVWFFTYSKEWCTQGRTVV